MTFKCFQSLRLDDKVSFLWTIKSSIARNVLGRFLLSMYDRCGVDVRSSAVWIDAYLRRRNLSNHAAFSLAKIRELILKSCVTYIEFSRYLANLLIAHSA